MLMPLPPEFAASYVLTSICVGGLTSDFCGLKAAQPYNNCGIRADTQLRD